MSTDTDADIDFGPEFNPGVPEAFEPETPQATITVDAPYGINPGTGKPYQKSPQERQVIADRLTAGRQKAAMERGSTKTSKARSASSARAKAGPPPVMRPPGAKAGPAKGPNYYQTVLGIIQTAAFALKAGAKWVPDLKADAIALEAFGGNIAAAVHDLAVDKPKVAAALDRFGAVGPYTALFAAVTPLLFQVAANHRVVSAGGFGTIDPAELLAMADARDTERAAA
jgi:hypothetical protein